MKIAISGASGLIGSALTHFLINNHHEVIHVLRPSSSPSLTNVQTVLWSDSCIDSPEKLENLDAFVCLNGANIGQKRWTSSRKKTLCDSRISSSLFFAQFLNQLQTPPAIVVAGSAIGFYGPSEQGAPFQEGNSPRSQCFLSSLCHDWENAWNDYTGPLAFARTGVVLSSEGGALQKMLPPFRFGLGGPMGSGKQRMSVISLTDCIRAFSFIIEKKITGPVNLVNPAPVTHKQFCQTLAKTLHRPCFFPVPSLMVRLAFGQLGQELILDDAAVSPHILVQNDFRYLSPDLQSAIDIALQKPA